MKMRFLLPIWVLGLGVSVFFFRPYIEFIIFAVLLPIAYVVGEIYEKVDNLSIPEKKEQENME